jgi:uncharacterized cupin superfamily protein
MRKVNLRDIPDDTWVSPKGKFAGSAKGLSLALGRQETSTDLMERHPFDVEICRIPAGRAACPYHSHSAQWEFYHVISGRGMARHEGGQTSMESGDSILFKPGEAHQFICDGPEDLVLFVVADNPMGESCHYPDSQKWLVRSPVRQLIRSGNLDYYDGEE